MNTRPRLLDLYCGGGGAALGYDRSGFYVTGVDNVPQKEYPFAFIQSDAIEYLLHHGREYDAIHASPPCQLFSRFNRHVKRDYPNLIPDTRDALKLIGKPWVIENVEFSPLIDPILLCGAMFDLRIIRHRMFETSWALVAPLHICWPPQASTKRQVVTSTNARYIAFTGWNEGLWRKAAGLDWLSQRAARQAIPPAYTEYIGCQLQKIIV